MLIIVNVGVQKKSYVKFATFAVIAKSIGIIVKLRQFSLTETLLTLLMVFTLRHSRHVGGRKQKISN